MVSQKCENLSGALLVRELPVERTEVDLQRFSRFLLIAVCCGQNMLNILLLLLLEEALERGVLRHHRRSGVFRRHSRLERDDFRRQEIGRNAALLEKGELLQIVEIGGLTTAIFYVCGSVSVCC